MRIIGIDPGIRHTGYAIGDNRGKRIASGVLIPPIKGKLLAHQVIRYVLTELHKLLIKHKPKLAAVEEVVWQGRRKRIMFPLSLVAGAVVGFLLARGISVYVLTPTMKKNKPQPGLSDHENDAYGLLNAAVLAEAAVKSSTPRKPSAAQLRKIIATEIVHGNS
mgnify:CR=1 FL=1